MKAHQPVLEGKRIKSLDVIRGFALLGILLMNIHGMGLPFAYSDPTLAGGSEGLNLQVWVMNNLFFEGTMRGLFTLIYGASVLLLLNKLEETDTGLSTADMYFRRITWLLFFGLVHAYVLLWDGEILYPYAVFGFLLFAARKWKPIRLLTAAAVLLAMGTFLSVLDYQEMKEAYAKAPGLIEMKEAGEQLSFEDNGLVTMYEEAQVKHAPEEIEADIKVKSTGSYLAVFKAKAEDNTFMQSWFTYRYWTWDLLPFMLIGMAFFQWRILHNERSTPFYLLMSLLGYGLGLAVNYFETRMVVDAGWDSLAINRAEQTYHLGRLLVTFGHVGAVMLMIRWGVLKFLQRAMAAVGRMAFTNYVTHSIIAAFIFFGFGFGQYGQLERYELYYIVFSIWAFQLIVSPIWLSYFHFGPLEWMWRSLTYGKAQPFRKK